MGRILAIDFGKKHIGLALSDETQTIAQGLEGFHYMSKNTIMDNLEVLIKDKDIEKIVLGNPISMSGNISQIGLDVLKFKKDIENNFQISVDLLDERFTTERAKQTIDEVKRKKIKDKSDIDKISAIIILQDYLSQQKK